MVRGIPFARRRPPQQTHAECWGATLPVGNEDGAPGLGRGLEARGRTRVAHDGSSRIDLLNPLGYFILPQRLIVSPLYMSGST